MEDDVPPECRVLSKDVGTWDAEALVWASPGAEQQTSRGLMIGRLTGAGRWLVTDYIADSGFEGHGVYGWDPARKRYVGTWVDNMRPFLALALGDWDAATSTMTYVTEIAKPDGSTLTLREVTQAVDEATQVFRAFVDGFQMMQVTYRRRAT
jgi:Protein of unknown function (DUF1579)